MIVFLRQTTMPHPHDISAADLFAGKHARQERIECGKRIVQDAARQSHHRRFAQISHQKHRAGQNWKSMGLHHRAAAPNSLRRLVIRIDRHTAANENYVSARLLGVLNQSANDIRIVRRYRQVY